MAEKILLLANNCSGLLSFRREVVEALVNRGFDTVVHLPYDARIKELEELGCRVICSKNLVRKGKNPLKDLALLREYKSLMRSEKPQVVLTYTIKPNVYGGLAAKSLRIPYIVNITGLGTAVENPGMLQKLTVGLYRTAMSQANTIFFQNDANRSFFAKLGINCPSHRLIPGSGVNLSHHALRPYPDEASPVRFLFISRLMKQKGIEEYFACAEHFKGRAEFHILGECEEDYAPRLKQLEADGIVRYHGKQKDVRPFITEAQCLIHPTYYPEGMSNVILESAAAGRPVITTDRAGCREGVDNGITGFLVPERDLGALIQAVEHFLSLSPDQRRTMGLKGREKMEREFDRRIVVDAYLDAINKTISKE
jgi:glycosyltransferase